jgi:hypothetical protein
LALAVFGLTHALSLLPHAPRGPRVAPTRDAGPASDVGGFWTEDPERFGPEGEVREPPERDVFACLVPRLAIAREEACERGASYPECRWQLPDETASGGLYAIWRNTTPEHRWARPALVSLVLAAAREYAMRWPGERVTVGDLDAAGPRHQTHTLVELHMVANLASLTHYHASPMVNEEVSANDCPRVDVDARAPMRPLRHHAGDERHVRRVQHMG